MKIMQIITDYITQSLLTTQGDMVVRGAAIPERLAAVAEGQVLKSAGVGAKPAWGVPRLGDMNFTSGVISSSNSVDFPTSGLKIFFIYHGSRPAVGSQQDAVGRRAVVIQGDKHIISRQVQDNPGQPVRIIREYPGDGDIDFIH